MIVDSRRYKMLQLTIRVADEFHDLLDRRHLAAAQRRALDWDCMGKGQFGGKARYSKGLNGVLEFSKGFSHVRIVLHRRVGCDSLLNEVVGELGVCSHSGIGLAAGLSSFELD